MSGVTYNGKGSQSALDVAQCLTHRERCTIWRHSEFEAGLDYCLCSCQKRAALDLQALLKQWFADIRRRTWRIAEAIGLFCPLDHSSECLYLSWYPRRCRACLRLFWTLGWGKHNLGNSECLPGLLVEHGIQRILCPVLFGQQQSIPSPSRSPLQ